LEPAVNQRTYSARAKEFMSSDLTSVDDNLVPDHNVVAQEAAHDT